MTRTRRYDLVAIGGGTAGLVATAGVAGLGGRAALIERDRTGGDCLWTGCVPSKALLAAAATAHTIRTADRHGIAAREPAVDFPEVMASLRRAQRAIEPHDSPERLRELGVDVIEGHGRFVGPGRVLVGEKEVRFRAALVCTGARPELPPIAGLDTADVVTSDTVWDLDELPRRLVVIGGGPVGCELAQAFARLGSEVTVVERLATLLPGERGEVGSSLAGWLRDEGVEVRTGVEVAAVESGEIGRAVRLADGTVVEADRILVAAGRRPRTDDLGLDTVGVDVGTDGGVVVDDRLRTTGDHIYAAGDVTATMAFTHVAAHQARLVVTNAMFGTRRRFDTGAIPYAVFTDPEIARVGLDADAARRRWGARTVVARFDHRHLDRAVTHGGGRGWVELVGDPRRRLVGATVVGDAAGETIAELTARIEHRDRIEAVSTTVHAYPTMAEGPSRAADELLRARWFAPRITRFTRPLLAVLRRIDPPGRS